MMRGLKQDRRGFSLVELIVTVLIIAIVSVALAPQVVRWVENSRIATDLEFRTEIEKACQFAMTDEKAFDEVKGEDHVLTITKLNGTTTVHFAPEGSEDTELFWQNLFKAMNCADETEFRNSINILSTPTSASGIVLTVYVYRGGHTFSTLEGFSSSEIKGS